MPFIGELSALLTAFLWSVTAIAFERAAKLIGSELVNFSRLLIALILLGIIIFLAGLDLDLSLTQIQYLILSGLIGLVAGDGFLFKALQLIGARISMLIMAFVPAMSTILAFFFLGEQISVVGFSGMLITLGGIIYVVTEAQAGSHRERIDPAGVLFAFIGAEGQAGGLILAKAAFNLGEINGFVATFFRILAAVVLISGYYLLKRNRSGLIAGFTNAPGAVKFIVAGTITGPVLGITFSLIAIAYALVGIASTIMATAPVIMLPISYFYLREKISFRAAIGAVASVAGVAILFIK